MIEDALRTRKLWKTAQCQAFIKNSIMHVVVTLACLMSMIFMTHYVLDGQFIMLLPDLLLNYQDVSTVFPTSVTCEYKVFGKSGSHQSITSNCLLPLNIINDKLFLILWGWYFILSVAVCIEIIMMLLKSNKYTLYYYMKYCCNLREQSTYYLLNNYSVPQIIVLLKIKDHLPPVIFYFLINEHQE